MLSEAEKGEMFNQAIDMPDALRSEALSISLKPEKIRYSLRIKPSDLSAVKKSSGLKFSSRIGSTVSTKGHRNIGFEVSGPRAKRALNAGCPLDLSLEMFPVGKVTRTVFESAAIILTRTSEDEFSVEVWRSFAPYLRDFFVRIAHDKRA